MSDAERWMREAVSLGRAGMERDGGPFGAVVVHEGAIVGRGHNEVTAKLDPTAHAEVMAIRAACQSLGRFELRGCELYTSCEPCPMCLAAIYWARLDRVYYACTRHDAAAIGFDDAFIYEQLPLEITARSLPMEQVAREESLALFRAWSGEAGQDALLGRAALVATERGAGGARRGISQAFVRPATRCRLPSDACEIPRCDRDDKSAGQPAPRANS